MTLACKIADILALASQGLNHLISGQDALHSADERKAALRQLSTTVQAVAKLAGVAQMEAQGACGRAAGAVNSETEGHEAEVEILKAGGSVAETAAERIKAEMEKLGKEVEKSVAETARLRAEAEKVGRETERAVAETERLKAEAMIVRSEKMRIDAETERLKALTELRRGEAELMEVRAEKEAELEGMKMGTELQPEKPRREAVRGVADSARKKVEVETVDKEVERLVQPEKAEGTKPNHNLLTLEVEMKRQKIETLDVAQAGNDLDKVQHSGREIRQPENGACLERGKIRGIRTRAERERMSSKEEAEKAINEAARAVTESAQEKVEVETVGKDVEPPVDVLGAGAVKPYPITFMPEVEIQRKRAEVLRVAQTGDQLQTVRRLAREIKELENQVRTERARRTIQQSKEEDVLQAVLNS